MAKSISKRLDSYNLGKWWPFRQVSEVNIVSLIAGCSFEGDDLVNVERFVFVVLFIVKYLVVIMYVH